MSISILVNTALPRRAPERPEAGSPHKIIEFNDFHRSGANPRFMLRFNRAEFFIVKRVIPIADQALFVSFHPRKNIPDTGHSEAG